MGITAKQKGWELGEITVEVDKTMTCKGPRKIESIELQIAMPSELTHEQLKVLQEATKDCPVLRNLEGSIEIIVNWRSAKRSDQTLMTLLRIVKGALNGALSALHLDICPQATNSQKLQKN